MGKDTMRRRLEELNLLDDFLFGSMVSYPEIGERFVRMILSSVLGKINGKLTVVSQKVMHGSDTDTHGARLDVYLEEASEYNGEEEITVYDVEPDQNVNSRSISSLPRRVRFYHSKIDTNIFKVGDEYEKLQDVFVIFITSYDPLGLDRMVYTIRNKCEEEPGYPYDDGARTIFLYTKGKQGAVSKKLRQLLQYMECTTEANAVNDELRELNDMVNHVKHDKGVSGMYLKTIEREQMLINRGREEGRTEGIEEGVNRLAQAIQDKKNGMSFEALASMYGEAIAKQVKIVLS